MFSSPLSFIAIFLVMSFTMSSATDARRHKNSILRRDTAVDISGYTVPLSNDAQSLPSPTGTIKAIALGRGTQNYTCNSTTPSPVPAGATAELLDATPLLPLMPKNQGTEVLDLLPSYLIAFDFATISNSTIPVIGHHYFNSDSEPCFDLGILGFLKAKTEGDIPAPPGASPGPDGTGYGAVDWLLLKAQVGSRDLKEVYRVETAGGKAPPLCKEDGTIQVQYAALYWFYD